MRARSIEVRHILLEHPAEVGFAHDQEVIEALAAQAPQQAFADRIRLWCPDWCPDHLDPTSHRDGFEVRTVLAVIIADQVELS
jgi:hypothetical protein